jgi:hypothetical protein
MQLERQLKIALDESRLLILGAQVLFGFQFNGVFQEQFEELPAVSQAFVCAGLILIMTAIALLIAPSMQHRIVERGQDSQRVLALATAYAGAALLPMSIALALDIFVAMERVASSIMAIIVAATFFWYRYVLLVRPRMDPESSKEMAIIFSQQAAEYQAGI